MVHARFPVSQLRSQFPALARIDRGQPVVYLDGPAGSQVPQCVADAISRYLLTTNCNRGGVFPSGRESDRLVDEAHQAAADFLGTSDPNSIVFGANMTTLTFAVSRALSRTWSPGDEVIVTQLDHDGNVSPWVLAARDAGAVVKTIPVRLPAATLDLEAYDRLLSPRTRLVAVGYASNATGTINPVAEIVKRAQSVGAITYIDAVHYAPHSRINVTTLDCDFLVCSAYKFFGPHLGVLYGRKTLLETLEPYKLRVCTNSLPGKWMTGTQAHELLAGTTAAIDYLAALPSLADGVDTTAAAQPDHSTQAAERRTALDRSFELIVEHEHALSQRMLAGLAALPNFQLWGQSAAHSLPARVPTFSLTHARLSPAEMAKRLADQGLYAWHGNHYALPFSEAAGLEPHGTLRIGFLHYNTLQEVDRVLDALAQLDQ
jgi:cysteine desulfurase family protein (TIGR01976 family)